MRLITELSDTIYKKKISDAELRLKVRKYAQQFLNEDSNPLSLEEKNNITSALIDDIWGYGPIEEFLLDNEVTEIMVNGPNDIFIEKFGKIYLTNKSFLDHSHLLRIIDKIVSPLGRRVDEASPYVDSRLPDGSRVNAIIYPLALTGPYLTIRKFAKEPFTIDDFIEMGTCTQKVADFLKLEYRPANIEGKGEITIRDLVRNSLRMRPDRIIVGEVRGGEALDMLQAMNTGHDGSLTTLHANSPRDAISRLETLVLMAGLGLPLTEVRPQH